jgi:16S rRNA U1498 N3-methylase RsmE
MFEDRGFKVCSLGAGVLKTDTAVITAIGIANEVARKIERSEFWCKV